MTQWKTANNVIEICKENASVLKKKSENVLWYSILIMCMIAVF